MMLDHYQQTKNLLVSYSREGAGLLLMVPPAGVVITAPAAEVLSRLQTAHGPVMFHQSGGCCDGSSPMCYPLGDFLVGDRDVLLGILDVGADGVPVWISGPQYAAHYRTSTPNWSSMWCRAAEAGSAWRHPRGAVPVPWPRLHRRRTGLAGRRDGHHRRRLRAR